MRTRVRFLPAAALLALVLASCSAPAPDRPLSAEEFWSAFAVHATEADPAFSLDELVERSSVIVTGRIVEVQAGPSHEFVLDNGEVDVMGSSILAVIVSETVTGAPVDRVQVWISQENASMIELTEERLPAAEFLWFLRPSEQPSLMLTTTLAGVIGVGSNGELVTLRDPGVSANVIPEGARSILELIEAIREIES